MTTITTAALPLNCRPEGHAIVLRSDEWHLARMSSGLPDSTARSVEEAAQTAAGQ
jgi:hypothetical protein